jgi:hypothetical protein
LGSLNTLEYSPPADSRPPQGEWDKCAAAHTSLPIHGLIFLFSYECHPAQALEAAAITANRILIKATLRPAHLLFPKVHHILIYKATCSYFCHNIPVIFSRNLKNYIQ